MAADITNLQDYAGQYVSVSQLARYWRVSPKQIYKQIEAGTLGAVRLGPRSYRVQVSEALHFESRAQVTGMPREDEEMSKRGTGESGGHSSSE